MSGKPKGERWQLIGRYTKAQSEMGIQWTLKIKKKVCPEPLHEAPLWKVRRVLEAMEDNYRRQFVAQKQRERQEVEVTQQRLFDDG